MLTKSLHTITAATNVARFIVQQYPDGASAPTVAREALEILGYHYKLGEFRALINSDPTIARIVAACETIVASIG